MSKKSVLSLFILIITTQWLLPQQIHILPEESVVSETSSLSTEYQNQNYEEVVQIGRKSWAQLDQSQRVQYLSAEILVAIKNNEFGNLWKVLELTESKNSLGEPARTDIRFIAENLLKMDEIKN